MISEHTSGRRGVVYWWVGVVTAAIEAASRLADARHHVALHARLHAMLAASAPNVRYMALKVLSSHIKVLFYFPFSFSFPLSPSPFHSLIDISTN